MRKLAIAAFALVGSIASPAFAQDASVANEAIRLCRAEVAAQTGLSPETVRLDSVRVRLSSVRVDLDTWRDGRLVNVRCNVERGEGLRIASITPALQTAAR